MTWSGIAAPTSTDWIGLYSLGAADTGLRINIDLNRLQDQVDLAHLGIALADGPGAAVIARTIPMNLGGVALASQPGGSIPLVAGDELLKGQRIDFIKIDVQGMELAVLSGLERTIAAWRPGIFCRGGE